ncbi:MAG: DUF2254 domain-containing protein [Bacteriovoracaceae bacterium]|nr:DUF2254 domain-containing protein [Bacteriovoracaceae bacterium]
MVRQWLYNFHNLMQRLSVRCSGFALLAVASSLIAVKLAIFVPDDFADLAGGPAVDGILSVMASSMLVVVTFSLSTMVAAYSSANQNSTPRATNLIINDSKSHGVISIFLGAFIYSVVSLIALSTHYYGKRGRVILLIMTVAVLSSVVTVIIRWVEELKNMGSAHESIKRVESATLKSLQVRTKSPPFECQILRELPSDSYPVFTTKVGHIQNIDVLSLGKISNRENIEMYLVNDVGASLDYRTPLLFVRCKQKLTDKTLKMIRSAFAVASERTFQNDPRYGLSVLSGIGVKALSPSLNDPGTAIDVIGTIVRVLSTWQYERDMNEKGQARFGQIYFPELKMRDLFNDAFFELVSAGAQHMEVVKSLQKAFQDLSKYDDFTDVVREHSTIMASRTEEYYKLKEDVERLNSDFMIGENQRSLPKNLS